MSRGVRGGAGDRSSYSVDAGHAQTRVTSSSGPAVRACGENKAKDRRPLQTRKRRGYAL
jgi:hypothetical protein